MTLRILASGDSRHANFSSPHYVRSTQSVNGKRHPRVWAFSSGKRIPDEMID